MAKKPEGCKVREVKIKRKSGKVVATFKARSGRDCKPRTEAQRKKSTRKQGRVREAFAEASRLCFRSQGLKPGTKQFGNCMKGAMQSIGA